MRRCPALQQHQGRESEPEQYAEGEPHPGRPGRGRRAGQRVACLRLPAIGVVLLPLTCARVHLTPSRSNQLATTVLTASASETCIAQIRILDEDVARCSYQVQNADASSVR